MVQLSEGIGPAVTLSPTRDALNNAWLGGSNLLQALLKLFPNTRHREEHSWAGPLQSVYKRSLKRIWARKKDLANIAHVL